jgi:hypothetical protein
MNRDLSPHHIEREKTHGPEFWSISPFSISGYEAISRFFGKGTHAGATITGHKTLQMLLKRYTPLKAETWPSC